MASLPTPSSIAFGRVLRRLRTEKGWSQERLAYDANLDRTYLTLLEGGQSSPTLKTIIALCGALGVTLEETGRLLDDEIGDPQRKL